MRFLRRTTSLERMVRQPLTRRPPDRTAPRFRSEFIDGPIAVICAVFIGVGTYLLIDSAIHPKSSADRIDVIKTSLTLVGFIGATLAAVYAYRRQRLTESDAHRADAVQLSSRYSQAAEQLGHDSASVRLAGVYAMSRLADDWEEQRQTCVDVLCAYLRMPFDYNASNDDPQYRHGEEQVRTTIQRVIADHLRPSIINASSVMRSWSANHIDLQEATLKDLDFREVQADKFINFAGASFVGYARFTAATFSSKVDFGAAKFFGHANFGNVKFFEKVVLTGAAFDRSAHFGRVAFSGYAGFEWATFSGYAGFNQVTFSKDAIFANSKFADYSGFDETTFLGAVSFASASFSGNANYRAARFAGATSFSNVRFAKYADFYETTFAYEVNFSGTEFSGPAIFGRVQFQSRAEFSKVTFRRTADFDRAVFSGPAGFDGAKFSVNTYFGKCSFSDDASFHSAPFYSSRSLDQVSFLKDGVAHTRRPVSSSGGLVANPNTRR